MYKIICKDGIETDMEIIPKPITLEQYCQIYDSDLHVSCDSESQKDYKWYASVSINLNTKDIIVSGSGSTQLKALSNLVDDMNKKNICLSKITLGRKGWIKRNSYK